MIIVSFNVRGLGGRVKMRKVRELVSQQHVEFLALQETKLETISSSLCYYLWGSQDCEWTFLPSEGNSGGILSIWKKDNNLLLFIFTGQGFVGVCLESGIQKKVIFVVNVYAKCDLDSKRRLWENLVMSKRGFEDGAWCFAGDFNAVYRREERRGVSQINHSRLTLEMRDFEDFLLDLEIRDTPLLGRNFTWFYPNGSSISRIDRFLISNQ
ncbi:unnamed protein product [Trifolium pratense]|uniref:Uncharacterized protein n=1 Tax=Trifolium pratense TaxID=57577 RepID=A0ACB0M2G2_TRIPR|nr:unnamed protein product [Trifolium pratense]